MPSGLQATGPHDRVDCVTASLRSRPNASFDICRGFSGKGPCIARCHTSVQNMIYIQNLVGDTINLFDVPFAANLGRILSNACSNGCQTSST
mmetsp:Transcript_61077/g.108244  ORF Transcript_61077/g.108244 Transcript_61077/m.108244 type:complete len:92 (+) Transcript_61077:396-671(+)